MIATFGKGGFIGSYLPPEFVGVDVDVTKPPTDWPDGYGFEAAVNLACVQPARGRFPLMQYFHVNMWGNMSVVIWAAHNQIYKVITMASQKTTKYGEVGKLVLTDHVNQDFMDYAHHDWGLQTIVLRLPPVVGPGPYIAKSGLGQMIEGAKQGRIEVWGNPSNSRAVISVHDAVSAIEYLAHSDLQGVFSIGIPLSLEEEAQTVREVFGGELVYRPEIDNQISQDIPVTGIPGWEPRWDFERMVRELKDAT